MDEGIVSPVKAAEFIALGMLDGIAMKVARCGGLWHASRITSLLSQNGLKLFASGLTDPELSLAASIHLFAWAGLELPAALNGPQYLAGRGTGDPSFRASRDRVRLPHGPGLGVSLPGAFLASLRVAAQA
jgi:muconate cycloisomerase